VDTVLISLLTLVTGALVSGVLTYLGTRSKLVLDYDADLREKRIIAYSDLWCRLEPLAKYVSKASFSDADATNLAESLQSWYFEKGGLFLSTATREDYFALQDTLRHMIQGWGWESPARENLTPATREHLRTHGSRLRTGLIRDVGTRARPKMKSYIEPVDRSLAGIYERDGGQRLELSFAPRMLGGTRWLSLTAIEANTRSTVKVVEWSPARLTIRAVLNDPEGNRRERVLLIEDRKLVEGPPPDEEAPARAVLWKQVRPPDRDRVRGYQGRFKFRVP
jgi:hypothetical protein